MDTNNYTINSTQQLNLFMTECKQLPRNKINEIKVGLAGEYLVMSKLIKMGYSCALSGNGEPYDILIDVPNQFEATRYHSLLIDFNTLPNLLAINSVSDNNEIMGIEHSEYKIYGVQFHPESIKTDFGYKIIDNFLKIA